MKLITSITLFVVTLFWVSCKHRTPEPCDNVTCGYSFECNQGVCKCPPNTIDIKKECVKRASDVYYSISDCACYDTLVMIMPLMPLKVGANNIPTAKLMVTFETMSRENPHTINRYIESNQGDTFWIFGDLLPRCKINGVRVFPEILGRYTPAKDTIFTTIYWHADNVTVVDTCEKVFVR
jgi:hypothetical protein